MDEYKYEHTLKHECRNTAPLTNNKPNSNSSIIKPITHTKIRIPITRIMEKYRHSYSSDHLWTVTSSVAACICEMSCYYPFCLFQTLDFYGMVVVVGIYHQGYETFQQSLKKPYGKLCPMYVKLLLPNFKFWSGSVKKTSETIWMKWWGIFWWA